MSKTVNYCYRCGRRIGRGQEHCYFCTAPVRRVIREKPRCPFCAEEIQEGASKCPHCNEFLTDGKKPRNCPFCGEVIKAEAIKCPHCREHLIEQPETIAATMKDTQAQPTQNFIFVIDRALTGADQPLLIPAGERVSGELAEKLSGPTLKAIELGMPQQVDTPGVKALPSAEAKALIPMTHFDDAAAEDPRNLPAIAAGDGQASMPMVIDVDLEAQLPATKESLPKRLPLIVLHGLGRLILNIAKGSVQLLAYSSKRKKVTVTEAPPVYRECPRCNTEVFTSDNFCYHCGLALTKRSERHRKAPGAIKRSNASLDAAILLTFAAYFIILFSPLNAGSTLNILLLVACALGLLGLLRRPGITSLLWALASFAAAFWSYRNFLT
jgi:predicted amidophosphoribosyltransferase